MLAPDLRRDAGSDASAPSRRGSAASDEFTQHMGMSPGAVHALLHDLSPLRESIYWADFLMTSGLAYLSFGLALSNARASWSELAWLVVSSCAVYRMTLFTHELAHVSARELRAFRRVWNLVCGVPLLVPSFLYEMHAEHHDRRSYASLRDGEYRAFALLPRAEGVSSVLGALLAVPLLVLRFLVLAPLSWLLPPLRRFVLSKMSALVIEFRYERAVPSPLPARWLLQEAGCFLWCATLLALTLSHALDARVPLRAAAVLTGAVLLNALRVLCAHRYRSQGESGALLEQVLDSNNYPQGLAWLWAPLGLRYHAVHHLAPSLPYHALGRAHRRLMQSLPEHSAFRQTNRRSFLAGVDAVIGRRRQSPSAPLRARAEDGSRA